MKRTRVAGADETWLRMDRPDNPMMITALLGFEGPVPEADVLDVLWTRLVARYPKFSQRLVREGARTWWADDPAFDLRAHVHRVGLPAPGGTPALQRLVGDRMSTRLDPERPPWHVDLVDVDGRSALVVRLHHVLADGISLARVLLQLADDAHGGPPPARPPLRRRVAAALRAGGTWVRDPTRWAEAARQGARGASEVAALLALSADPPTPLRGPLGSRKLCAWLPGFDLERVKAVGRRHGATVNDVLLATLAQALGAHLRERGAAPARIRTFVPVNLRPLDRPVPRELGNQFGLVLLDLPLAHTDPLDGLRETKARMDRLKRSPQAAVTYGLLQALGETPDAVERALVGVFGAKASLITTNVPGPRAPIALAGHTVDTLLAWVPQSSAVGLGVSILSYAGTVRVGVAADARCVPDPASIADGYARAFRALEQA